MTRLLCIALTLLSLAAGGVSAEIRFKTAAGPDGAKAILIEGAKGEADGVASEYSYLDAHYAGWKRDTQAVMSKDGRTFDVFQLSRGSKKVTVYFDITPFFGKF